MNPSKPNPKQPLSTWSPGRWLQQLHAGQRLLQPGVQQLWRGAFLRNRGWVGAGGQAACLLPQVQRPHLYTYCLAKVIGIHIAVSTLHLLHHKLLRRSAAAQHKLGARQEARQRLRHPSLATNEGAGANECAGRKDKLLCSRIGNAASNARGQRLQVVGSQAHGPVTRQTCSGRSIGGVGDGSSGAAAAGNLPQPRHAQGNP